MFPTIFRAPADITSDAFGGEVGELFVQATPDEVVLPDGFNPAEADFVREGPDLMMTGPDGTQVLVADFFMMETPPTLIGESGARVAGDLAVRLAGPVAPGQLAGDVFEPGEIIGRVTEMNGEVVVIRADGTRMSLQTGDAVFQGDILDTGADAGVGLLLADGTALAMGEEARMVLDEMVYDPDIQDGNIAVSVMRGLFTIVSGEISKTGPEAMMIHTPVATIGIRGTQIGLDLSNGKDLTVVMMEEADGFVGEVMIINDGGAMTINQAYFAVTVSSYMSPPVAAPVFTMDSIASTFGVPLTYLPTLDTNANDYGQQAGLETDLSTFETAAGDLELGEQGLSGFESGVQDGVRESEIEPEEGLAEIKNVSAERSVALDSEGEQTFVTNAGQTLGADELEAEANVVFGDEIAPIETTPNVSVPVVDDTVTTPPEPNAVSAPESTPTPTPTPESAPAPEPVPVNVAPVAEPGTAIMAEDNVFNGQLSASDLEGGVLTFSLADDGGPANGTVIVNPDGRFTYEPNTDFGGTDSFTYMVSDDAGAMALASVSLTITPVADVPQVAVASVTGYEDSAIALALAVSMPAGTQESIAGITISGVPEGATLSAGSDNGDGRWVLELGQLEGLSLTPPKDFNGTLDLGVSATSTDGGVSSSTFALHVSPLADVPQLAVADVVGKEDSSIMLTIAAAMPGSTNETIESIVLSNVPNAVELSAGMDNGDGTWTLMPNDLSGLTMTPSPDYNGVFDIGVRVTSSDGGIVTDTFGVNITPVADQPIVATADVTGSEDAAIVLTLAAHMPVGTSETVETVVVSGVPNGAVLSQGVDNGDGTWTLRVDQLADLTLTPPTDFNGTFSLNVFATSSDGGRASANLDVTVTPLADVPQLAVADVIGAEDGVVGLALTANMPAGTTEALYTITVEGVPDGASLSAGMDNGDGTWTLTPDLMDGLTLNPPQDFNGTFDLSITAASTDGGSVTETMGVTITPVADTPVVAVSDATGAEDSSILLTIAANMPGATSETLDTILITGVPDGAVLSAGSDHGDGTWTLEQSDLAGLSITPPSDYNGTFNLGVGAVSSDGSVASSTLSVNVGSVSDIPVIAVSDAVGSEDTGIALTIAASMPAGTNETLDSITIAGVPDGASLSAGTDNGDGTWSVSGADLAGLTLSPPNHYSGTIQLSVTAVSSDGGTSTSTLNAAVTPVADAPILQISDVVVTMETPPGMEIEGSKHSDLLLGTMGDDEIDGGSGHDIIFGDTPRTAPVEDDDDDDDHDDDDDDDDDDEDGHGRGHGKGHDEHGQGHGYGHDDDDDDDEDGDDGAEPVVVALDINAALSDVDGSEALSLEIAGVPDGATLSVGTDNGDGRWTLLASDLDHLDDLTMTLAPGTPQDDFALDVTASSSELETGEAATTTGTIDVSFDVGVGSDDEIDAGKGNDLVYGGGGDDKIDGGQGHDILFGGEGNDEIEGAKGSDILVGGAGDDELDGGKGSDVLIGGAGDDVLEGGKGDDAFVFRAGDGNDIILDLSHQDVLRFEGQEFNMDDFVLQSDEENDTTTITFGDDAGVSVTLNDVDVSSDGGYTVTQDGDAVVVTFDKSSID